MIGAGRTRALAIAGQPGRRKRCCLCLGKSFQGSGTSGSGVGVLAEGCRRAKPGHGGNTGSDVP